eukprot:tig00000983_g5896.t2
MGWVDAVLTKVFGPKSAQPPPSFNLAAAISTTIERKNNELILKNDGKLPWADVAAGALGSTLTGIDRTGAAGVKVGQAVAAVPELAMKGWHYAKIAAGVAAHLTSSGTLEPTGLHLGMRSVPRNARCVGLWRGVMKASRIVAMDGFVRSVDLAYLAESAQEVGARLGLLYNSHRTCDWKMRVSDSPAHVEADIMVQCRPGRSRAMIIAETPAKAIELQEKIAKQALEQLSLGGAQYAKEKSVRFTNDGPVRIVSIDVSEEGAYKACDVLIATSALGAGVDFSDAHFDKVYGVFQAEPAQLEADDIVQLLFRVRRLRKRSTPDGEHLLVAVRKNRTPSVAVGAAAAHWRESDDDESSDDMQRYLDLKASHRGSRRAGMPTRRLAVAARLRLMSTCALMNVQVTEDQNPSGPKQEKEQRLREIRSVLEAGALEPVDLWSTVLAWRQSRESLAKLDIEKVASLARTSIAAFLAKDPSELTEGDVAWMWDSFYSIPLTAVVTLVLKHGADVAEIVPTAERLKVSKVVALFKKLFGWRADGEKKRLSQQSWQVIKYLLEKYLGVRRAFSDADGGQMGSRKRRYITWRKTCSTTQ